MLKKMQEDLTETKKELTETRDDLAQTKKKLAMIEATDTSLLIGELARIVEKLFLSCILKHCTIDSDSVTLKIVNDYYWVWWP